MKRSPAITLPAPRSVGVRIAGTGSALPSRVISNDQIASIVDTNDEWIRQRTGIATRRVCDPKLGESNLSLCTLSLKRAIEAAHIDPRELDLLICATITQDMRCPSTACLVAANVGCTPAGAWDLGAACSGFVYGLNAAHDLIRAGTHRTIGVIGADCVSSIVDYTNRGVCILFGDAAGAVVLRATDDLTKGCVAQVNKADGSGWGDLFMPAWESHIEPTSDAHHRTGCLQMNGKGVFKFAVGTFQELIAETLTKAGLSADEIDMFVCHQSNARILEAARERFGIPADKIYINIDRVGNTSAGSVPLCLDELVQAGRVKEGMRVMFVAFGAGLTWGSSLWQL
jgi:3-oxoacyl-[acyl-carrier-protein] synthase-3